MRKFEYRRPRMKTGFSVDFVVEGETLHGLCSDVSDEGIRAEFDGPITVGSSGLLILRHPTRVLKIEAHVAYFEKCQVGLSFLFQPPQERATTTQFIDLITNRSSTS